jgi:hypothetical protein
LNFEYGEYEGDFDRLRHITQVNPDPPLLIRFRVKGPGLRVHGIGCRVQGTGFRVRGLELRVKGSGYRVQGVGFGV